MKVCYDFETEGIESFPNYPPKPVGLALWVEGQAPRYYAWGHPTENNCTEVEAKAELAKYWNNPDIELIAQNMAFDIAVAVKHWGFELFNQATMHDTMVQAFLIDPHAATYALKPSAEKYLGLPPEEQDAVYDWLYANGVIRAKQKDWGAFICKAPGSLVGEYAIGDVIRTMRLFNEVYSPKIVAAGMEVAYRRELQLIPIMLENSLAGIAVDVDRLTNDVQLYENALTEIETLLFQELDCEPFNVDSDEQLAFTIDQVYPGLEWVLTKTGKRSTSKANLETTLSSVGGKLGAILQYRASVSTCLNTFMKPWLKQATEGDRRIRCQWNTTRGDKVGARTGRLSSTPSLMNIPTLASAKFAQAIKLRQQYLPEFVELPNVRSYIVPDSNDHMLVSLDYSAQELRVLGHMEGGAIQQAYIDMPTLDMHEFAAGLVSKAIGKPFSRKYAKTVAFSILYGSGLKALADGLSVTVDIAQDIKNAYMQALPGIAKLQNGLKSRADRGLPIKTWGGRVYYCEEPKLIEGRWRNFTYKLLNYLVQGSSADLTKQALIDYHKAKQHGRLLLTVHDQIVISCPKQHWITEALILKKAMEGQALDAPLLADISYGPNLHNVEDYNA